MAGSKNRYPGGFDAKLRAEQEAFLRSIGQDLPDQDLLTSGQQRKYSDRLRMRVRYWRSPEGGRRLSRISNAKRDLRNAALRETSVYGNYKDYVNYPEKVQLEIAQERVRGVIKGLRSYEETFLLSKADVERIKRELLPIKLQEVKTGVDLGDRMSIQHDIARKGVTKRGVHGERITSGVTSIGNITDKNGKLLLIPQRTNASLGAVIEPGKLDRVAKEITAEIKASQSKAKLGGKLNLIPAIAGAVTAAASPFFGSSEAEAATPQGILGQVDDFSNVMPSKSGWFGRVAPVGSYGAQPYIDKRQARLDEERRPPTENELLGAERRRKFMSALDWPSRKSEQLLTGGQGYQDKWNLHPSVSSLMQFGIDPSWLVGGPLVKGALKGPKLVKSLLNL